MYKFRVGKLGPLTSGELELGKLTLVCGGNNSGKTYLTYMVYGFFHRLENHTSFLSAEDLKPLVDEQQFKTLVESGVVSVPVSVEGLVEKFKTRLDTLIGEYQKDLDAFFAAPIGKFSDTEVDIEVDESLVDIGAVISSRLSNMNHLREVSVDYRDGKLLLKTLGGNGNFLESFHPAEGARCFSNLIYHQLVAPPFFETFIATSERSGISLFHKELDLSRNRLVEALQQMDRNNSGTHPLDLVDEHSARYALPIRNEIGFVRDLDNISRTGSQLLSGMEPKLHEVIEDMMQASYATDSTVTKLVFTGRKQEVEEIPLLMASSSAKELSSLYHYLKHKATKHDLLVLDEPESHLSTLNQMKLARLLSMIVGSGIRVLLSTHSEILLKELNNLIMLNHLDERREEVEQQCVEYKGNRGIASQDVKAYHCANNTVGPCLVNQFGIHVPNVNEQLAKLNHYSNILGNQLRKTRHD